METTVSVLQRSPMFSKVCALVAVADCAFAGRRPRRGELRKQWSFGTDVVVEHKAQRHFEGFLCLNLFVTRTSSAAGARH